MNKSQLTTLRNEVAQDPTRLGYAALGQNYPAIADLLNQATSIANPQAQGEVPNPPAWVEVLATCTPTERVAVLNADTLKALCVRLWTIGENADLSVVVGFVAGSPTLPFETVSIYGVADAAIKAGDAATLGALVAVLVADGKITTDTAATMAGLMARTMPDPVWTATTQGPSRAQALGLPMALATDVQQVL